MRTVCYQPGPLTMPDLGEFSMVEQGSQAKEETQNIPSLPRVPIAAQ